MRLLSTDPDEPGIFAVGQVAYGVIALGQMATGVIAIGQVARGVIAIGQGAIGLLAVGQGAVGMYAGIGMIGVFGRGFPLPLVPKLPRPRQLPATTDLSQVRMGYGDGWIDAHLQLSPDGVPQLIGNETVLDDVRLAASLRANAREELGRYAVPQVVAHVRRVGDDLICDRLLHVPVPLHRRAGFQVLMTLRVIGLLVMAVAFWFVAWAPIAAMFR